MKRKNVEKKNNDANCSFTFDGFQNELWKWIILLIYIQIINEFHVLRKTFLDKNKVIRTKVYFVLCLNNN